MTKVLYVLLGWVFFCGSFARASQPPKAVLLTALDPSAGKSMLDGPNWNGNQVLEEVFRKRFENSGYQLEVHHDTDAQTLWDTLQDPDNIAVYFVGHAAPERPVGTAGGISGESIVADRNGDNLVDLFTHISPNLRYLALVGCEAQPIFDQFRQQGVYKDNPNLQILAFDHLVDPYNFPIDFSWNGGLDQAIDKSVDVIAKPVTFDDLYPYHSPCDSRRGEQLDACKAYYVSHRKISINPEFENGLPTPALSRGPTVQIVRTIPADAPANSVQALMIYTQDRVLGFFPKSTPGQTQTIEITLDPTKLQSAADLKLTAMTGINVESGQQITIGKLSFAPSWRGGNWAPLAGQDGVPLGVTENIFDYSGALPRF